MLSSLEMKKLAGAKAAQLVQEGMIVGLGSGSTAHWLITELGKRKSKGRPPHYCRTHFPRNRKNSQRNWALAAQRSTTLTK